jgi:hypothetical protein
MNDNQSTQSSNEIGRDAAGRDINNVTNNNYENSQKTISYIQTLYQKLGTEESNNLVVQKHIEEFNYYYSPLNGDVIGLEQKLINGNQLNFVDFALKAKERYHMKLYKQQFSEVAQKINIHLLSLVENYFMIYVYPKICNGKTSEEVYATIDEQIVKPLRQELQENLLEFTATDIQGMLYFLTGNCHIKWEK